jgi:hypothetical protein
MARLILVAMAIAAAASPALAHPGSHEGGSIGQLLRHVVSDPYHLPNVAAAAGFAAAFAVFGVWRASQRAARAARVARLARR